MPADKFTITPHSENTITFPPEDEAAAGRAAGGYLLSVPMFFCIRHKPETNNTALIRRVK